MKIRSKQDATNFLKMHQEFTHHDWIEGECWFRFDGENTLSGKPYTINHETQGIIGVSEKEAVDYVWRNRKRLNNL